MKKRVGSLKGWEQDTIRTLIAGRQPSLSPEKAAEQIVREVFGSLGEGAFRFPDSVKAERKLTGNA